MLIAKGADVNGRPSSRDGCVALCDAIKDGQHDMIQLLLSLGADPNGYNMLPSPLAVAVTKGDERSVRSLIKAGADVNRGDPGNRGQTPLEIAARTDNLGIFYVLMDADPKIRGRVGTAVLKMAVANNWTNVAKLLLSKGVSLKRSSDLDRVAQTSGLVPKLQTRRTSSPLGDHDVDENASRDHPLLVAVAGGCMLTVKNLLKAGADVNACGSKKGDMTALQEAVYSNNIDLVKLLIDAGANINAPAIAPWGRTALQIAVYRGTVHMVEFLLSQGADVNAPPAKDHGATALQIAVIRGHLPIALMLLNKGADVNAAPALKGGRTALEAAAEHGRLDMMYLMLRNDGDPKTLETRCEEAAKLASFSGHFILARLLREWK